MTASKTPEPDPRPEPVAESEPTDRRDDDATTEILAGLDADRTPTEVLDGDRGARPTAVLPETSDAQATEVRPETDGAHPTRVLPETPDRWRYAASEASAPRPEPGAGLTPPPAGTPPTASTTPTTATSATTATAPSVSAPSAAEPALRARVRWAGIIWGLVFAIAAATMMWVLADPERRDAVGLWWAGLTPAGLGLTALIVAGGLLLIGGLTGLARHLSTRHAESEPARAFRGPAT